ncbi:invasion associated locus B family protein [Methylocystis sp. FS]|uniref:invasion associated locus B family protein n=1 Tax=Methylocystis silviterrae TaxID=2743612 RepID=UPI001581E591|nr:invasion associated locus B family protein [Methylocystis silviterrae]NUJ81855.1 invasion associated locus B family protein [Methylocystis silviterrae]
MSVAPETMRFIRLLSIVSALIACPGDALVAQEATITKFGAWQMRCSPAPSKPSRTLAQAVRSDDQANVQDMVTFAKIPASPNAVIQIVAPLDTFLLEGARMKVDQDEIGKLPFFKGAPIGCAAEGPISDDVISKLLTGKNIIITIYIRPGEGLRQVLSLDGFADGYKALK